MGEAVDVEKPTFEEQNKIVPAKMSLPKVSHVEMLAAFVCHDRTIPASALLKQVPLCRHFRQAACLGCRRDAITKPSNAQRDVPIFAWTDIPAADSFEQLATKSSECT